MALIRNLYVTTWLFNDLPMSSLVAAYTDYESSLTQQGNMLANHATANA